MQTPNVQFDTARQKTTTGKFEIQRGTADGIQLFFPADIILAQAQSAGPVSYADGTATNAASAAVAAYSGDYPGTRVVEIQNTDAANAMRVALGFNPTTTTGFRIPAGETRYYRTDLAVNVIREDGADVTYTRNVVTLN